jgi:hypothetical protein
VPANDFYNFVDRRIIGKCFLVGTSVQKKVADCIEVIKCVRSTPKIILDAQFIEVMMFQSPGQHDYLTPIPLKVISSSIFMDRSAGQCNRYQSETAGSHLRYQKLNRELTGY